MSKTTKPRAFSYLRFSTPEQAKGDSSRRQSDLAVRYAREHGLELDQSSYQDLGVSAFRGKNATAGALRAFLEAVEAEVIPSGSYLLVENLDRLSRADIITAQTLFLQIVQAGINLVTLTDQRVYSEESIKANPFDMIISLVTLIRANEESATKARRLKASWGNKRAQAEKTGKPLTSRTPAWIDLDKEAGRYGLIPERAKVVQRIFKLYQKGEGEHSIVSILNAEKVPTFGKAKNWHRSYIHKILTNPATTGTCCPHKVEHGSGRKRRVPLEPLPNFFPPVIDAESFAKVQAIKQGNPVRASVKGGGVTHLLAGIARCPVCGGSMGKVNKGLGGGRPYLVCAKAKSGAGCAYRIVKLDLLEEVITDRISEIVGDAPAGDPSLDQERERVVGSLHGARDQVDGFAQALAANPLSKALAEKLAEAEAECDQLEKELAAVDDRIAGIATGPLLNARLVSLEKAIATKQQDKAAANAALRQVVNGVVVDYEAGRLRFQWRHGGETEATYAMPTAASDPV